MNSRNFFILSNKSTECETPAVYLDFWLQIV